MLLFLICMTGFAGVVDSAAGGGGLISLPAYLFAGLPVHYTYGDQQIHAPPAAPPLPRPNFSGGGAVDLQVGLLAAAGSFVGSAAGSPSGRVAQRRRAAPDDAVHPAGGGGGHPDPVEAPPTRDCGDCPLTRARIAQALAIGVGIGCYDGLFGPGTGHLCHHCVQHPYGVRYAPGQRQRQNFSTWPATMPAW